jgi:hypothetical protein
MKLRLKVVKSEVKLPVGQCALSLLILMLALSNLTALYAVEVFYTSATVQNVISNAETDALTWLYYNTPANAVILTFSDSSAKAVSAIAARKTLSYSDASSSWPLQLLFNSRLPEVTLYSLKNLGVTHIFVGERDIPILSSKLKDSYLNNLLPALPIVYQKNGFTIYNIPEYMLSNDSNYISFLVPKNLYKFLKVNDIPTLLELKDIFNYIYVYDSPVILNGSCILTSDYILMAVDQLKVIELESSSSMHNLYLKDMNITDVHLNGLVDLSIEASRLVLPSSYEGVITTLNLPNKFTVHVKLINAELKFKIGDNSSQQMRMTDGSIKMTVENSGSSTFKVAVRQPIINVNGVINLSSWHGIFWYKESAVVSFCLHSADIDGELTLQLTYTFGGYIFKILSVERINSVKWRS